MSRLKRKVEELELEVSNLTRENLIIHAEANGGFVDLYRTHCGRDWPSMRETTQAKYDLRQQKIIMRRLRIAQIKYFFTRNKKHFNNIV